MEPFDAIEKHAATVSAFATVVLALATLWYVRVTNRLVRRQDISQKREIVEKLYEPLLSSLDRQVNDGSYLDMDIWKTFKENEPFLAYHHLIPPELRTSLDELEKRTTEAQSVYDELVQGLRRFTPDILGLPPESSTGSVSAFVTCSVPAMFEQSLRFTTHVFGLVLDERTFADKAHYHRIDDADHVTLEISGAPNPRPVTLEDVSQVVGRFTDAIMRDEHLLSQLENYRSTMREVRNLCRQLDMELSRASRV